MKISHILTLLGVIFAVTLALVVGQRLSSEALSVVVGVMAGVGASIPTSLVVVWFAARSIGPRMAATAASARVQAQEPEAPRVIVVQQPTAAWQEPSLAARTAHSLSAPWPVAREPRRYTVLGGADLGAVLEDIEGTREVGWHH